MGRLGNDIARLRNEIADLQESRETMIGELKANRSRIQRDVGRMQGQFRERRQTQAAKIRQELGAFRQKISQDVKDLREANAQWKTRMPDLAGYWGRMREEIHCNMAEASRQGAAERAAYVNGIRRHLSGLHEEFTAFRNMIAEELDDMRRAWHGSAPREQNIYTAEPPDSGAAQSDQGPGDTPPYHAEEPDDVPDDATDDAPVETSFSVPDDLTMITGIAKERQQQLNAVGIATFEELSIQTAKELQVMLGKPISQEELQRWIDQAKELTQFNLSP